MNNDIKIFTPRSISQKTKDANLFTMTSIVTPINIVAAKESIEIPLKQSIDTNEGGGNAGGLEDSHTRRRKTEELDRKCMAAKIRINNL